MESSLMVIELNFWFKVSKNDNRCEYVNLGEGKHQLIIHKVSEKKLQNYNKFEYCTESTTWEQ